MANESPNPAASAPSNEEDPASFPAGKPVAPAMLVDFDRELCELVADTAPDLFAVCEQDAVGTDEADGWVVAWGMAWEGGQTYVVSADGRLKVMSLSSPERALWWFGQWVDGQVRLVWLNRSVGAAFDRGEATAHRAQSVA